MQNKSCGRSLRLLRVAASSNLTIKLVVPVVMLDQVEKWNKSFQERFVKRSGQ